MKKPTRVNHPPEVPLPPGTGGVVAAQFSAGQYRLGLGFDDPAPGQFAGRAPRGLLPRRVLGVPLDALLLLGVELGLAVLQEGCPLRVIR